MSFSQFDPKIEMDREEAKKKREADLKKAMLTTMRDKMFKELTLPDNIWAAIDIGLDIDRRPLMKEVLTEMIAELDRYINPPSENGS